MGWSLTRREWLTACGAVLCLGERVASGADDIADIKKLLRAAHQKHGLSALLAGVWQADKELMTIAVGNSITGQPAAKDMHLRVGGVTLNCLCTVLLKLV